MDATAYTLHIYRYNILPPPKESPSTGDQLRFFSRLSLPFMTGATRQVQKRAQISATAGGIRTLRRIPWLWNHML